MSNLDRFSFLDNSVVLSSLLAIREEKPLRLIGHF